MLEVNRAGERIKALSYLHGQDGSLLERRGFVAPEGDPVKLSKS